MNCKKASKIMMIVVSLLLVLVIFTTNVLSGIYAKYVSKDYVEAVIEFKHLGVDVIITPSDKLIATVGEENIVETPNGNNVSLKVNNLKMVPYMDLSDALNFKFTGTAEVPIRVKIEINIDYTRDKFKITHDDFDFVTGTDFSYPIGVRYTGMYSLGEVKTVYACSPYRNVEADVMEQVIATVIGHRTDMYYKNDNGYYAYKEFDKNQTIEFYPESQDANKSDNNDVKYGDDYKFNDFSLGFYWPDTYPNDNRSEEISSYTPEQIDKIGTWIANNVTETVSYTFTVTIEQIEKVQQTASTGN